MSHSNQLILFARAPVYGAVKTRLAKDIGNQPALDFYRRTLTALIQRLQSGPWELCLSVATKGDEQHELFQNMTVTVQPDGDLGFRMQSELERFHGSNRIIIGSDIPGIECSHLQRAFDSLARHDMVFGPAYDGGFWLVGCASGFDTDFATCSTFMKNVRWSTEYALADTLATLPVGTEVAKVATLSDVDDGDSYRKFIEAGER